MNTDLFTSFPATFRGQTLNDNTAVLVSYTLYGDANLDRSVDFNDLVPLAQNYNTAGGKTWAQGDFPGDGAVDFNDLVQLAQNYNTSLTGAAAPGAPLSFDAAFAAAFAAVTTPAVAQATAPRPGPPIVVSPPVAKPKPPVVVKRPTFGTTRIKDAKKAKPVW